MQTLTGRIGRSLAAAFMAFAIAAIAQGALGVAGMTAPPTAVAVAQV